MCEKPDSDQTALGSNAACSCESGWTANLDLEKCYKRGFEAAGTDWGSAETACQVSISIKRHLVSMYVTQIPSICNTSVSNRKIYINKGTGLFVCM